MTLQARSQADARTHGRLSIHKILRNTSFESIFDVSLGENLNGSINSFFGLAMPLFWLASVAEQAGLSLTLSKIPNRGYLVTWLKRERNTTNQNDIK